MASQLFQLVMRSGPNPGRTFPLNKNELYIGRDAGNEVVINDSEVSRKHARIVLQAGGFVLEDLGSTNGTFVNGQRLMGPHMLRPGELIMFGENVSLTFEAGYDTDATMAAAPGPVGIYPQSNQSPQYASPPPQYSPPPPQYTPPPPVSQQPYSAPVQQEPYYEAPQPERRANRTWLYAGCGCLLVLACLVVTAGWAFDYLNLYCTPPFNTFFTCP